MCHVQTYIRTRIIYLQIIVYVWRNITVSNVTHPLRSLAAVGYHLWYCLGAHQRLSQLQQQATSILLSCRRGVSAPVFRSCLADLCAVVRFFLWVRVASSSIDRRYPGL